MKERLHVTAPKETIELIKEQAKKENRNVSNMTVVLIERGLKKAS
jgi:hypothetical protein